MRYGDITLIHDYAVFNTIEVKSSKKLNQRGIRQVEKLNKLFMYFETDEVENWYGDEGKMLRHGYSNQEINFEEDIRELINSAQKSGVAFSKIETGLYYIVFSGPFDPQNVEKAMNNIEFKNPYLTSVRDCFGTFPGYKSLILSLNNSKFYWDFIMDSITIFTCWDLEIVKNKFLSKGYNLISDRKSLIDSLERTQQELSEQRIEDLEKSFFILEGQDFVGGISGHFWGRHAAEFISINWVIEESIVIFEKIKNIEKN